MLLRLLIVVSISILLNDGKLLASEPPELESLQKRLLILEKEINNLHHAKMETAQCGKFGNLVSHFFDKDFVKATFLLKKLLKS